MTPSTRILPTLDGRDHALLVDVRRLLVGIALAFATASCGVLSVDEEPAGECGFPPGTELIFAGRSTTAALEVQEMVGDPMSHEPADIYITRDEFDQGELHGRLVCAIYGDPRGFTEVTMAPEGWDPESGRLPQVSAEATEATEATPPQPPPTGLARAEAIAAARSAVPRAATWDVDYVVSGPPGEILLGMESLDWAETVPNDGWLWRVDFRRDDRGSTVFVDFEDGTVYGVVDTIIN